MSTPDAPRPAAAAPTIRRRKLFYTAMVCFFVGIAFVAAAVIIPLVREDGRGITWVYLVAMFLTPLGFLLALAYALLSGRPPRQAGPEAGADREDRD